jgi:hypothetical protein
VFRCNVDTTHAAGHGHSSVCRTGSTLESPQQPNRATMRAVVAARGGGASQPRSGQRGVTVVRTDQMVPGAPSSVTTGRPASAQASIPPLTLMGS